MMRRISPGLRNCHRRLLPPELWPDIGPALPPPADDATAAAGTNVAAEDVHPDTNANANTNDDGKKKEGKANSF